jgi:hypothetical protein
MNVSPLLDEQQDMIASDADSLAAAAGDDENIDGLLTSDDTDLCTTSSQKIYIESGNDKKVLFLLCIGLNDNTDIPLFSFENEPWSRLPKNSSMRPRNTDFVHEITRRAKLYNILPVPRASNWKRPQITEWLEQNPVREGNCIEFLTDEVAKLRDILVRAQQQENELTSPGGRKWRGTVPFLRVIMCLTDDHVKYLFLNRANVRTRHELDARNSEDR